MSTRPHFEKNEIQKIKNTSTHFQVSDFGGSDFRIEGYWDDITGNSYIQSTEQRNPAALVYSLRMIDNNLPTDNNVLYGKIGAFGHLVHISELE